MTDFSTFIAGIPTINQQIKPDNTMGGNNNPFINSVMDLMNKAKADPTNNDIITPESIEAIEKQIEASKKALGITGKESTDEKNHIKYIQYTDGSLLILKKYVDKETGFNETDLNYSEKSPTEGKSSFNIKTIVAPKAKSELDYVSIINKEQNRTFTLDIKGNKKSYYFGT